MAAQKLRKRCGMVGFHMLNNNIVKAAAAQNMLNIFHKLFADGFVHRVEQNGLIVKQKIGIVTHTVRNGINTFKH